MYNGARRQQQLVTQNVGMAPPVQQRSAAAIDPMVKAWKPKNLTGFFVHAHKYEDTSLGARRPRP